MNPGRYAKAIVSALAAGASVLLTAMSDGSPVTTGEWATVGVAVLTALGVTYAVPNEPVVKPGLYDEPKA